MRVRFIAASASQYVMRLRAVSGAPQTLTQRSPGTTPCHSSARQVTARSRASPSASFHNRTGAPVEPPVDFIVVRYRWLLRRSSGDDWRTAFSSSGQPASCTNACAGSRTGARPWARYQGTVSQAWFIIAARRLCCIARSSAGERCSARCKARTYSEMPFSPLSAVASRNRSVPDLTVSLFPIGLGIATEDQERRPGSRYEIDRVQHERAGENQPAVAQGDASASRRNAVDNGSRRQRKEERHAERERENTPLHQSQDDGNRATENEQAVHNGRLKDSITHQLGPASSAQ